MLSQEQLNELYREAEKEHRAVGALGGFLLGLLGGLVLATLVFVWVFGWW